MTDVIDFLEHHGVKGQKWGIRNDKGHEGQRAKTKKIAKLDKKFENNAISLSTAIKVHNRAAELTNKNDVNRINNKPEYKNQNFLRDSPLRQKYYKEHQDAFLNNLEKAASEFGTNASGTKKYSILEGPDGDWAVRTTDISHADEVINVKVIYDNSGRITNIEIIPLDMMQNDPVEDFLEHHGVKGQKWGIRKKRGNRDAFRKGSTSKPKAKDLTDEELKKAISRMQMEKQYTKLINEDSSKINAGAKFAKNIGSTAVKGAVTALATQHVTAALNKAIKSKAK